MYVQICLHLLSEIPVSKFFLDARPGTGLILFNNCSMRWEDGLIQFGLIHKIVLMHNYIDDKYILRVKPNAGGNEEGNGLNRKGLNQGVGI